MKKLLIIVAVMAVAVPTCFGGVKKGEKTTSYYAGFSFTDSGNSDNASLSGSGSYGYFLTDTAAVSVHGGGGYYVQSGESDARSIDIGGSLTYYWKTADDEIVPYVGWSLGVDFSDSGEDTERYLSIGIRTGLLKFLRENVAMDMGFSLRGSGETTRLSLGLGLMYFFE